MKNEKNIKKNFIERENIRNYIMHKQFGETITFNDLQQFTSYDLNNEYENYKFKTIIMRYVKDELIEEGYILKSIRGKGYYILKQNQISSYTYRTYIKKPLRYLDKADTILKSTRTILLNKKELDKHNLTKTLNNELINENNKIINSKKYESLKNQKKE